VVAPHHVEMVRRRRAGYNRRFPGDGHVLIPTLIRYARVLLLLATLIVVAGQVAPARAGMEDPLASRLSAAVVKSAFPDADGIGDVVGDPPVAPALKDGETVGYVFSTFETVSPRGFGGEPFDIIVGLDGEGRITGSHLLEQHEPIIGDKMVPESAMVHYLDSLDGLDISKPIRKRRMRGVDGVAGATTSATLMHGAIVMSARRIARIKEILVDNGGALALDLDVHAPLDWRGLVESGSVTRLHLTGADVARAGGYADDNDKTFIDLYTALATPAGIGRNLFGDQWYGHHLSQLELGAQLVMIASRGHYAWKRLSANQAGLYERLQIVQGDRTIRLTKQQSLPPSALRAPGAPGIDEMGLFGLDKASGFDPLAPWRLELLVSGPDGAEPVSFSLPYRIPGAFVMGDEMALEDAGFAEPNYVLFGWLRESALNTWQRIWVESAANIAILLALLTVLTLLLIFQDTLSRSRRWHAIVRVGFLSFVLIWLGWIAGGQLSVINLFSYGRSLLGGFDPLPFLVEPVILIVAVYTAVSLVLLGRGVFCGWLCPYGAFQELANRLARLFRVPQLSIPFALNEKLWAIKYVAIIALVGLAGYSMDAARVAAEIEPFKTAITLKFERAWPYALYAGGFVVASLFVERIFCRFLCPLGGALAILGRLHMFRWLKRRPECGGACHICESSCPVQAIPRGGRINMNECFQCLDCQVDYFDETTCPPLVARRKRRARATGAPTPSSYAAAGAAFTRDGGR